MFTLTPDAALSDNSGHQVLTVPEENQDSGSAHFSIFQYQKSGNWKLSSKEVLDHEQTQVHRRQQRGARDNGLLCGKFVISSKSAQTQNGDSWHGLARFVYVGEGSRPELQRCR